MRLIAYRGWAGPDKAVVLGRLIEEPRGVKLRLSRSSRLLHVTLERWVTKGLPGAPVRVTCAGRTLATATDAGGFVDLAVATGGAAATAASLNAGGQTAEAELYVGAGRRGVISDIDDTVLETELSHPWRRGMQLMFSEQRIMRLPFDGIADLYRGFAAAGAALFYVSNAPWSLYHHVVEILDHHDIVKGPLLLKDGGLQRRAGEPHKRTALRRLIDDHPDMSFVLLGDSSRRDPLRYVEAAEAHPGRVAAIYIRKVKGLLSRRGDLSALAARAQAASADFVVAEDTATIAAHAARLGLL